MEPISNAALPDGHKVHIFSCSSRNIADIVSQVKPRVLIYKNTCARQLSAFIFCRNFVGQHTHPTIDQWYFMLDGADFIYNAGDTPMAVKEGDVSYTPHGMSHGSSCEKDGTINYLWFEMNRAWDNI